MAKATSVNITCLPKHLDYVYACIIHRTEVPQVLANTRLAHIEHKYM